MPELQTQKSHVMTPSTSYMMATRMCMLLWRSKLYIILFVVLSVPLLVLLSRMSSRKTEPPPENMHESELYCNSPGKTVGEELRQPFIARQMSAFTLRQIQIVVRHGDRAPIDIRALPNTNPVHLPCTYNHPNAAWRKRLRHYKKVVVDRNFVRVQGETTKTELVSEMQYCKGGLLTPLGILEHRYLGEHLAEAYKGFLKKISPKRDIVIQSTNYQRTIQSAASLIVGMFKSRIDAHEQTLVEGEEMFVINVHQDHVEDTHYLRGDDNQNLYCPVLLHKLNNLTKSSEYQSFIEALEPMMEKYAEVFRTDRKSIPKLSRVVDVLYTRMCHGQGIPRGPDFKVPKEIVNEAFFASHQFMNMKFGPNAELQTLSLLSQIAQRSYWMLSGQIEETKRLAIYAGHDSVITPFLINLDIYDNKWPPYASRIVFEVYTKDFTERDAPLTGAQLAEQLEKTYVRILYNGVVLTSKVRFCEQHSIVNSEMCPILRLYSYVSDGQFRTDKIVSGDQIADDMDLVFFNRISKMCRG